MNKTVRDIVRIDEELCDGCGECIISCAEGAIKIIDGKARLTAESRCDGFGACLGVCPRGAITIEKRAAEAFDEPSTEKPAGRPASHGGTAPSSVPPPAAPSKGLIREKGHPGGCPGSAVRMFAASGADSVVGAAQPQAIQSTLTQWPVQLMLVPPTAPFLKGREILLAADCCAFAYGDFHRRFLAGKALLVGCPKFDDLAHYRLKLEAIFRDSGCTGITVMIMEVPCCGSLRAVAVEAYRAAGSGFPLQEVIIGIRGEILRQSLLE
ncbi:MAG: 4Fe-4S dicluster domain-containing protein [candidate division Zixibacteria bacterium]|nr:4Fe-4S dicluster domain-containing protein [candidate division Zixibacteria bacterium]